MLSRWWAVPLVVVLAAAALPLASGNHPQTAHGDVLVFDHKTGNEWWVEVVLSGGASGSVQAVQAMDTGGAWTPLTKRSWGAWAGSFHIEPGHLVRFRASWSGGDMVDSCWFTHPAGLERCGTTSSSTTTTTGSGFDATFTGVRGNEWWVQANVASNGPALSKVDVRIAPDGIWKPLSKQSWGPTAWAASYQFPQGSVLQLRATASTGATDLSSCRQWIPPSGQDATIVTCPGTQHAFDATWSNVRGNTHWAEAVIRANAPIQMVTLMIDCDTLHDPYDMTYRSDWGKWVLGTIPIPDGSVVTMTAYAGDGRTDTSATYRWPTATVVEDCPPAWPQTGSTAQVRFRDNLREFDPSGGETYTQWDGLVSIQFTDGVGWRGTCEERVTRMEGGVWTNTTHSVPWSFGPPVGPVPAAPHRNVPGDAADLELVGGGCRQDAAQTTVLGRETRTFDIRNSDGDYVPIDAYHGGSSHGGGFSDYWWDARLGLMLSWDTHSSSQYHSGNTSGWLLDTDAEFR